MKVQKNVTVIAYTYTCDRCEEAIPAESDQVDDRPAGFYVALYQVTAGGVHQATNDEVLYFHTKECLVQAMQYQLSSFFTRLGR